MHKLSAIGIAITSVVLTACGGGSGGNSDGDDSNADLGSGAAAHSSETIAATTASVDANCDYTDAASFAGWGWNSTTEESCAPLDSETSDTETLSVIVTDPDCDYTDAASFAGWGWNSITDASCPPPGELDSGAGTNAVQAEVKTAPLEGYVVTPNESDPFSKFQLDDALYTNNVYDQRQLDSANNGLLIYYDGVQDFVRWEVPASSNNNPCVGAQAAEPLTLSYRVTSRKDSPTERNSFVRAFPAMVVGTMGGRYESWGVECGQLQTILPSALRHGGSPVYQMETVAEATGFPVMAGDLNYDVRVSLKADLESDTANKGVANLFMDSYWHNVSDAAFVPDRDLVNTINGISSNFTKVWNLNIWFDYPRFEGRASSWTGGFKIGSVSFTEGGDFDVHFKVEGSRDGHIPKCRLGTAELCFLYIGLVATDKDAARNGITVNYNEISDWMMSAEFRDLILTGAFEPDTPAAKAYAAWQLIDGTDNDNNPDIAHRGPRFPDKEHVIGGIHLGSELWYNPNAETASIVFDTLGVEVEGKGQFGRYVNHR